MAMAVLHGDAFPQYVFANQNKLTMVDVSTSFFDTETNGSFGKDYAGVGSVNFVSQVSLPIDTNRVPGFPVSENFIWKKYRVVTSGFYGDQIVGTVDDTLRNSVRQFVSHCYLGPYETGGAQ